MSDSARPVAPGDCVVAAVGSFQGSVIDGKYRIGRRLGAGGMGDVYEAIHEGTERAVAVKILHPEYAAHPEALVRFNREARAAGRIGHDNICEVVDVGRMESGAPYLVMPLLRGLSLADVMRHAGPLPVGRCVDVVAQILAALGAAHAAGIVHRDLKPDNVFLVRMGDRDDFVKILDFGIAKIIRDHITDAHLTQTGTVMGTPYYMSPEQARGIKDLDHRVDVYAAGVILYEMLTTRTPFEGDTYNQLLSAILLDPFPLPRALRADIPPSVEAVVLRAMARDRNERFCDAAAMRRALLDAVKAGDEPASVDLTALARQTASPFVPARPGAGLHAPAASDRGPGAISSLTIGPAAGPIEFPSLRRGRHRLLAAVAGLTGLAAGVVGVLLWSGGDSGGGGSHEPRPSRVGPERPASAIRPPPADPAERGPTEPGLRIPAETGYPQQARAAGVAGFQQADVLVAATPAPAGAGGDVAVTDAVSGGPAADAAAVTDAVTSAFVHIVLEGLPAGATVMVDGREVRGPAFDLPRQERDVRIAVTAVDYLPWGQTVSGRDDATIRVRMHRRGARPPVADVPRGRSDAGAPRPTKTLQPFGEGP